MDADKALADVIKEASKLRESNVITDEEFEGMIAELLRLIRESASKAGIDI